MSLDCKKDGFDNKYPWRVVDNEDTCIAVGKDREQAWANAAERLESMLEELREDVNRALSDSFDM